MNYETIKSFILFVLIGASFLLSFILWSYQPNYDSFYDASYVNEADIGGSEKTKNELIEPTKVVFKDGGTFYGFKSPSDQQAFYKDMATWVLSDYHIARANGRPNYDQFVEVIFPADIPAELMVNLFNFNEEINMPKWSFSRIFLSLDEGSRNVEATILSAKGDRALIATINKTEVFHMLQAYLAGKNDELEENIRFGNEENPIYVPQEKVTLSKKTMVASKINPQDLINALFLNPSLVTPNVGEAYFTDGQRGMRVFQGGLRMEFINPVQETKERLTAYELIEKSTNKINEHKGWVNTYLLDAIHEKDGHVLYRLNHEGYTVFDRGNLGTIEQEWRGQELYEYHRPLIKAGNLLNTEKVTLPSGEDVRKYIMGNRTHYKFDEIKDVRIGYFLTYNDGVHSLTLEPDWFILYQNDWLKFSDTMLSQDSQIQGGD